MNWQYGSIRDFNNLRAWALFMRQIEQRQDMPAEYSAVVDRRFWELIGDSDADRRISRRRDCAADSDNGEV